MISWIQKYFQHHFRIIFAVLLGVLIIAFVFTIGAAPGLDTSDRPVAERHYFSYDLNKAADQQRLFGDAQLSASLQFGAFGGISPEQIQNFALQRGAALHLADQWHIPAATDAELENAIKRLSMFQGADGQFDAKAYSTFRDNLKAAGRGMSEGDIKRILSDDIRVEKVNNLLSGPGYVLPADVRNQLERSDTTWTIAIATTDYNAYKVDVKPTDAELTKFFEENSFRYEVPPRVRVDYVDFPAASFLPSVTVTEAEVRAFYDENPARFPKPADPAATPATPAVTPPATDANANFAAVRAAVEAALKLERAQRLAVKAASDFTVARFEGKITRESLPGFLAGRKLELKHLAPFTRADGPAEFGGSPEVANEAFKLGEQQFISEAVRTPSGAAVLVWQETLPARKPLFSEVREKVVTDYTENEKRKRFVEAGKTLKAQLETRLKSGDSFEQAAAAVSTSSGIKLDAKTIAPFTPRTPPMDLDRSAFGPLERLEKGQVSDMVIDPTKGLFVYAIDKKAPDLSEANPRYAETRTQLASYGARMGASAYLSELIQKELKQSAPPAE